METIMRGKINRICIKYVLHVFKLQANLIPVSKHVLNDLKVQFNLNKYVLKAGDSEANAIVICKGNLYKIKFIKVHRANATNLVQSPTEVGTFELWHCYVSHLNMKGIHSLQKIVSGINMGKHSYVVFWL